MSITIPNVVRKTRVDSAIKEAGAVSGAGIAEESTKTIVAILRAADDGVIESESEDDDDIVDSNGRRDRSNYASKKLKTTKNEQMLNLPSNLNTDQLSMLVNRLLSKKDVPIPYSFAVELRSKPDEPKISIDITTSISDNIIKKGLQSGEDVFNIVYTPQAVFRVRAATRCSSTLEGHEKPILCAQFSPDGSILATGSGDHTVRLWDLQTETPKERLKGHVNNVLCLAFSPNGKKLASGSLDKTVRIWPRERSSDTKGMETDSLCVLTGHKQWITSVCWEPSHKNPSSSICASSSKDGTVKVWDVNRAICVYTLAGHTASVNVVCWGGSDHLYTASSDRTIKVWAWDSANETATLINTLSEHAHWVTTLSLSTASVLQTGPFDYRDRRPGTDEDVKAWSQERYNDALSQSKGLELLVSGSDDFTLFIWSPVKSKKPVARLTGHQKLVNHVCYSSDGRLIASASFDNSVKLWDGKNGKFIASLRGHVANVYRLAFSPDNRLLISASKDTTLKVWDVQSGSKSFGKMKKDLPGHTDEVYCVDWSTKGDKIASGGKDCRVKIWRH